MSTVCQRTLEMVLRNGDVLKEHNLVKFIALLENMNFSSIIFPFSDINKNVNIFLNSFKEDFDEAFPLKWVKLKNKIFP